MVRWSIFTARGVFTGAMQGSACWGFRDLDAEHAISLRSAERASTPTVMWLAKGGACV